MPKPPMAPTVNRVQCVLGIDPSLVATAIVVVDATGRLVAKRVFKTDAVGPGVAARVLRYTMVSSAMERFLSEHGATRPVAACIEGYSMGSNQAMHSRIIEMGYELRRMLCSVTNAAIHEVAPTTLKKFCTGKGVGDKSAIASHLSMRYGVQFDSSDEADAYGLARMAACIARLQEPVGKAQQEAVETVLYGAAKKRKKPVKA